jgi:hypothetical protein
VRSAGKPTAATAKRPKTTDGFSAEASMHPLWANTGELQHRIAIANICKSTIMKQIVERTLDLYESEEMLAITCRERQQKKSINTKLKRLLEV